MSVLDRSALEASPLADLHAVASELSIDGYRRLRRAELIDAVLDKQVGGGTTATDDEPAPKKRPRRAPRSRPVKADAESSVEVADGPEAAQAAEAAEPEPESDGDEGDGGQAGAGRRGRRGRRGGRGRGAGRSEASSDDSGDAERETTRADDEREEAGDEPSAEGVVELLPGGSGFVRVSPPEPSDDDVYISSAQVKRCELVSGDRVSGPKRAPRRSERFASLIRIETINGRPASELADSVRFDDLPAAFASDALKLSDDDPSLKVIDELTPFGKGSRVSIVGAARTGKTELLKRIAQKLTARDDLQVQIVLSGARPEEITEWNASPLTPAAACGLTASQDVQGATIEPVIDQARRLAARGADAVVLIDSLDGSTPQVARKALGAARNIVDGGSLTVIATAAAPLGGETTVIALDAVRAGAGQRPALDPVASWVLRPELLVGEAGAEAITRSREEALG